MAAVPLAEIWRYTAEEARRGAPRQPLEYATAVVGQRLGPVRYVLDGAVTSAYARFLGRDAGLFPTVPARHTALLRDNTFVPGGAGINARTELELFRPPAAGDEIVVTGAIADKYVRRGKPYVVLVAESRNQRGELVDRLRLTEMLRKEEVAGKWEFLRGPAT
jgi:hypothetical protein